jgi:hypothetical protein
MNSQSLREWACDAEFSETELEVTERGASQTLQPHDILFGQLVPIDGISMVRSAWATFGSILEALTTTTRVYLSGLLTSALAGSGHQG